MRIDCVDLINTTFYTKEYLVCLENENANIDGAADLSSSS